MALTRSSLIYFDYYINRFQSKFLYLFILLTNNPVAHCLKSAGTKTHGKWCIFFPLSVFLSLLSSLYFYDAYTVIMHMWLKIETVTCSNYFELFLNFCLNNFLIYLANFHSLLGGFHLGEFSSLQHGLTFYTWRRQLFFPPPKVW